MEKLTWFKFSPINWLMGKIQRVPETTQMRFIKLMCLYWNKECILSVEDAEMEIDKKHLDLLISKKVVKVSDGKISIDFLNEQSEGIKEKSRKNTENIQKRWAKNKPNPTDELPNYTTVLPNDTDKIREEEIREEKNNIIINNSAFAKICLSKEQWCETVCMQNKIHPGKLEQVISDFEKHLIATSDQKKNHSEFEKHFVNWIPKQDYSKTTVATTGGTNQKQPQYHD